MNEVVTVEQPHDVSRVKRLKAATHAAHESLDKAIMAGRPFSSRERYGLLLIVQHDFHRDIDALYGHADLDVLLPDLDGRRRFGHVRQDLADLGMESPQPAAAPVFGKGEAVDIPTALG